MTSRQVIRISSLIATFISIIICAAVLFADTRMKKLHDYHMKSLKINILAMELSQISNDFVIYPGERPKVQLKAVYEEIGHHLKDERFISSTRPREVEKLISLYKQMAKTYEQIFSIDSASLFLEKDMVFREILKKFLSQTREIFFLSKDIQLYWGAEVEHFQHFNSIKLILFSLYFFVVITIISQGYNKILSREVKNYSREIEEINKQITKEKERAETYLNIAAVILLGVDNKGCIFMINKKGCDILGASKKELTGTDWIEKLVSIKQRVKIKERFNHLIKGEADNFRHEEIPVITLSGTKRYILWNSTLLRDEQEGINGVLLSGEDITQRHEYEDALKKSNNELQHFAYVASHDLQEPLRMVSSFMGLLERRYKGKLDEKADKYINFAVDGATRMQRLINALLDYSRIHTQSKSFDLIDTEQIMKKTLEGLSLLIQKNKARIKYDLPPVLLGDEIQLQQVFQNLIINSIKYRGVDDPVIHISYERLNSKYVISLKDNGKGIRTEDKDTIFNIFQRGQNETLHSGTGIGLSMCKKIIERHNGLIWLESEPGKGTTFFFSLPVPEQEQS